jgi:hypothetical protein
VKVFDHVAFLKLPFERFDHFPGDFPVFVTGNAIGDLSVLNANVRHDRNCFVIAAQVAERRPVVLLLGYCAARHDEHEQQALQQ